MSKRGKFWRRFVSSAVLSVAIAALTACSAEPLHIGPHDTFQVGNFRLWVESVDVKDRSYQGVDLDVEIRLGCDGGNRFDRMDFAEVLSRKGHVYFRTSGGWKERLYFLTRGDDASTLTANAYPPAGSKGYILSVGSPFGEPAHIEVDLGR